jgi:hypothetical protein
MQTPLLPQAQALILAFLELPEMGTFKNARLCVTRPRQNAHLPNWTQLIAPLHFVAGASLDFEVFRGSLTKSFKAGDGGLFIFEYLENGQKLGNRQQFLNLLCQVQQLELATGVSYSSVGTDKFANPRAVDVVNIGKIENDFFSIIRKDIPHRIANRHGSFAQCYFASAIQNLNISDCTFFDFHLHLL